VLSLIIHGGLLLMSVSLNNFLLSVATTNSLAANDNHDGLMVVASFQQCKVEYGKSYATAKEERRRLQVYTSNVHHIESANY
jgi:hypothetical protein